MTAAVLLGPGATRKAAFVRVYGAPAVGSSNLALRIQGAERLYGIDDQPSFHDVTVEVMEGIRTLDPEQVTLGSDGVGELRIKSPLPLHGPFLRIRHGEQLLAEGSLDLSPPANAQLQTTFAPLVLPGQTSGNIEIQVESGQGALAASFNNVLTVKVSLAKHLSPEKRGVEGIAIEASARGATLVREKSSTYQNGTTQIGVKPYVHHVELRVTAHDAVYGEGTWEGTLPIIPGAIWVDYAKAGFGVISPVPRDYVYISGMSANERLYGEVVPVSRDNEEFYRGGPKMHWMELEEAAYVVVSGDPTEQGSGTIAWPVRLGGDHRMTVGALHCLLDGGSAAEARERGRASRARRLALMVVIASTIFEILFMLTKSRRAQSELEKNLVGFVEGEPSPREGEGDAQERRENILATARQENPVLRVALAISLVLVAFSMIGALAALQW